VDLDPDLTALRALGGFFVLRTGEPPHGPLPALARAYATRHIGGNEEVYADPIIFRVRKVAESIRAPESRVAASVAHQGLAARLWSVAVGSAVLYGRVPDLDARLLRWDPDGSAPDDLWLTEVRALPAGAIGEVVREGHLAPLAPSGVRTVPPVKVNHTPTGVHVGDQHYLHRAEVSPDVACVPPFPEGLDLIFR
jgi:hypothetical protein